MVHVYGEPGTGKSTLGYHVIKKIHENGLRAIWIDFNSSFSMKRLLTLAKDESVMNSLRLIQLSSNNDFKKTLSNLKIHENEKILVLDNFTYYYQLTSSKNKLGAYYDMVHHQLMRILATVRRNQMTCLLINQVRSSKDGNFYPVGGRLMNVLSQYVMTTKHESEKLSLQISKGKCLIDKITYSLQDAGWMINGN